MKCTVNAQKESLSQTVTLNTATKGQKILMNAGTVYSMWHWYKGSENTNDYREMYHSLKTENRLQHQLQWRCPESRQCRFVIKKNPITVPGWHFAVVRQQHYEPIFFSRKIHASWEIGGQRLHYMTLKPKLLYWIWVTAYMSEKNISLSSKQVPYELCSLQRTKVMESFHAKSPDAWWPPNLLF